MAERYLSHPAAELFPLMGEDELQALADDIKANGLCQPIVLDGDGRILDGRNRLAACEMAGVDPIYETVNGVDPLALVVSLNVKRRNLTPGQRAIAAAEAWDEACKKFTSGAHDLAPSQAIRAELARLFDTNTVYVQHARALVLHAPDAAAAVKRGEADLRGSYERVREQRERIEAIKRERNELRERLEELAKATTGLELLAPIVEQFLPAADEDTVKRAVAQSMPATDLAEPSDAIRQWDAALAAASKAAAAIRQLPPYPDDGDSLLALTGREVAKALGDAMRRLLDAIPAVEEQHHLRSVK